MELTNSKRLLYTASYVTTEYTPEEQRHVESKPGGGLFKANQLRLLDLTPEDFDRFRRVVKAEKNPQNRVDQEKLFQIAEKLAVTERPISMMELAAEMAPISYDALNHFIKLSSSIKEDTLFIPFLLYWSEQRHKISPIGRLHLERIEMYPVGVQKGELVFTVPMAPGETVKVSHKEWSTSTREFEEVVQDFFESYSERGVAEKTDSAMSTENEAKHSSAINFGASLSGSYGSVTLTTTLGITNTNEERNSVKNSMQKNREVTEKASARTRKEHKVSMKLETKTGVEDQSAKTITNKAKTAVRIDYYRMMRKWRTDLYRYGLRQTYDIAIPLPGVRLWALHRRVAKLDEQLRAPLSFPLKPEDINSLNYRQEAIKWGTTVQDPQPNTIQEIKYGKIDWLDEDASQNLHITQFDIDVPEGYLVSTAIKPKFEAHLATWKDHGNGFAFSLTADASNYDNNTQIVTAELTSLLGKTGHLAVVCKHTYVSQAAVQINLTYQLSKDVLDKWQFAAWTQLRAAAEARHREEQERLQEERDQLWRLLNGKDTLSLRRLEREELVRLVMKWLLGPTYPLISTSTVEMTLGQLLTNEETFQRSNKTPDSPTFSYVREKMWQEALLFGDFVKFIHQAVEWENLLYFLYPYFWGSETIGRDKLLFEHNDTEHERFLRAGYARIVLPVRPGFEQSFTKLMEEGTLQGVSTQPYITIAEEIANFARTNYSGIPPANPEQHARPLLYPEQRATWDIMQDVMKLIDEFKAKNGHYPVKLDELDETDLKTKKISVDASGLPVDAWGNPFVYKMPGLGADYDLISLGANNEEGGEGLNADISSAAGASLVATWFDYTPTSGIDIEVDTKPGDIA
ncbi:MAG: type II secretion system protein GspG [Candidatus Binatia bacterium]